MVRQQSTTSGVASRISRIENEMEIPVLEPMNLHTNPSAILDWIDRFELWCSLRSDITELNKSKYFLLIGGKELYTLMKNLSFPNAPATKTFSDLKYLLLKQVLPVNFQAA